MNRKFFVLFSILAVVVMILAALRAKSYRY